MLDANQNVLGLAATARPGDGGGARRAAFRQFSDSGRRAGLDAAMVKATEASQARGQIGGILDQTRGADVNLSLADLRAGIDNRGQTIEERMGLGRLGLDAQTVESETRLRESQIEDLKGKLKFAYDQLAQQKDQAGKDRWAGIITGIVGALGGAGAAYVGAKK
jgi:hypothetical protein